MPSKGLYLRAELSDPVIIIFHGGVEILLKTTYPPFPINTFSTKFRPTFDEFRRQQVNPYFALPTTKSPFNNNGSLK